MPFSHDSPRLLAELAMETFNHIVRPVSDVGWKRLGASRCESASDFEPFFTTRIARIITKMGTPTHTIAKLQHGSDEFVPRWSPHRENMLGVVPVACKNYWPHHLSCFHILRCRGILAMRTVAVHVPQQLPVLERCVLHNTEEARKYGIIKAQAIRTRSYFLPPFPAPIVPRFPSLFPCVMPLPLFEPCLAPLLLLFEPFPLLLFEAAVPTLPLLAP